MLRFLRSSTFRLALLYVLLFGASVLLVMGFVYTLTVQKIERRFEQATIADTNLLFAQYAQSGLAGLIEGIEDRIVPTRGGDSLYLLLDEQGQPLAGNVRTWPPDAAGDRRWVDFPVVRGWGDEAEEHQARGISFTLSGGARLLVGRDLRAREDFTRTMHDALVASLLVTLILGIGGGLLISRQMLQRLDAITRGALRIIGGETAHRMPVRGTGDEFDRLAETLNRMLEEIARLMAGLRRVTDNVAHDLRRPLTRLRNRLESALRGQAAAGDLSAAVGDAIGEVDELLATFDALLSIASAESDRARAEMEPTDLALIARDAVDLYAPAADERGVATTVEAPGAALVTGNRQLLFQALANLLDNAIKHTPEGGRIAVRTWADPASACLSVRDTGPGIPEDQRRRVLEPFVRLDTARSTPGNGLGLSLVAAIARLHGAALTLEDGDPGLLVTMTFPTG